MKPEPPVSPSPVVVVVAPTRLYLAGRCAAVRRALRRLAAAPACAPPSAPVLTFRDFLRNLRRLS